MRYLVRRAYRYGNRIYLPGESMLPAQGDVQVLQQRGIIGGPVVEPKAMETAEATPMPEAAVMPESKAKPEPKHLGGGWYELPDGSKVRKSELPE